MLKILLDWDNTIYNFNREYFAYLNEKYYLNLKPENITDYDFSIYFNKLGFGEDISSLFIRDMEEVPNFYKQVGNFKKETINNITSLLTDKKGFNLSKDKVEITIYTKVLNNMDSRFSKRAMIDMFMRMYPLYEDCKVIFEENDDKFKDTNFNIVIDDNPKFVCHYLKQNPHGVVILPLHKYNDWLLDSVWKNCIYGVK